jgi:hypothetical protein
VTYPVTLVEADGREAGRRLWVEDKFGSIVQRIHIDNIALVQITVTHFIAKVRGYEGNNLVCVCVFQPRT